MTQFQRFQLVPADSLNAMIADIAYARAMALANDALVAGFEATLDGIEDNLEDLAAAAALAAVAGRGFYWTGAWVTATAYALDQVARRNGASYVCIAAHTSGSLSEPGIGADWEDFWELMAAKGDAGAGTGDMLGSNNLSDVANATTARSNIGAAASSHSHSAADLTTGTLDDARLSSRLSLGVTMPTITDVDTATENGWYGASNSASNAPPGADWGFVRVERFGGHITQTFYNVVTDAPSDTQMWRRSHNGTSWEAWYRLRISEAELDARYAGIAYARAIASQEEAETGTATNVIMTPQRASQHGDARYVPKARQIVAGAGLTGGGALTADRGLSLNYPSQADAEAGTDNVKPMTSLRVAQAIAAQVLPGVTSVSVEQSTPTQPAGTTGGGPFVQSIAASLDDGHLEIVVTRVWAGQVPVGAG